MRLTKFLSLSVESRRRSKAAETAEWPRQFRVRSQRTVRRTTGPRPLGFAACDQRKLYCINRVPESWSTTTSSQAERELRGLTFELSGRQRQGARPGPVKMYRVPPARAWWPAVGAPLERGVRHRCAQPLEECTFHC
jgi:hypothetical protein